MNIPDSPIDRPAAWFGVEQRNRNDWIYLLSDAEKEEPDSAIRAYQPMRRPLSEIGTADYPLPVLGLAIQPWMLELDADRAFVLVRGFPAASYSEEDAVFAYWLISLHMGRPASQNRKGDLLGHVREDGADPRQPGIRLYRTWAKEAPGPKRRRDCHHAECDAKWERS